MHYRKPKSFRLAIRDQRLLVQGYGACFASDLITVDGHPVRLMYRLSAKPGLDSGWRFMSGLETEECWGTWGQDVFDVNTIANYDSSIVPFLDAPSGSAFRKPEGEQRFTPITDWSPPAEDE